MEKMIGDRISTLTEKNEASIVILPKRKRWKEALLVAWVVGFTTIGVYVIYLLMTGLETIDNSALEGDQVENLRDQKVYLWVFLGFWAFFEYSVVKGFLWVLFGKELIRITSDGLTIKNSIFSYGKAERYFLENIKNIELIEQKPFSFSFDYENAFWRKGTDNISFEYKNKTINFGKKLDPKDANLLKRYFEDKVKKLKKSA